MDGYCRFHGAQMVIGQGSVSRSLGALIWLVAAADGFEHERDARGCMSWPFNRNTGGYGVLSREYGGRPSTTNASRWLCEMVHGLPPDDGQEWFAAHTCGRGRQGCVTPEHLEWKTRDDNEYDRVFHGSIPRGERSVSAVLTEADVRAILVDPRTALAIAKDYGVTNVTVSRLKQGQGWRHVYDQVVAEGLAIPIHPKRWPARRRPPLRSSD